MIIEDSDSKEQTIAAEDMRGRIIGRIPFIGRIVLLLQMPSGIIVSVAVAIVLLENSYRREAEEEEAELEQIRQEIRQLKNLSDKNAI
jgi:CHASE3 domain sensor protein